MRRLLALLILLAVPAWATTYYVDCASSGGDGTTTDTSGAHAAFATIAAAQAAVTGDQHDNSLLFKRGCTWREQFTVGAAGTAGHPFTVGKYGTTGADPIISGSDLVTTWTLVPGGETGGLFVADAEDGGVAKLSGVTVGGTTTFAASTASKNNGTYGYEVTSDGTNNGIGYITCAAQNDIYVRFYMKLKTGFSTAADWTSVALAFLKDAGGTARMRLMVRREGAAFTLQSNMPWGNWHGFAVGSIAVNTWVRVEIRYLVHASTGGYQIWIDGVSAGSTFVDDTTGTAIARTDLGFVTVDGTPTAGSAMYLDDIKADTSAVGAYSAGSSYVYSASAAGTANVVQEDGVQLTPVASLGAVSSAGKWYSDGITCYAWATDNADPDTHTMEVGHRTYGIWSTGSLNNGKSYVTVDGIQCTGCNDSGIAVEWGGNYWTIQNCTVKNIGHADWGAGIRFRGGTNNLITQNIVSYAWTGITLEDWGPPNLDSNTISKNTIHHCQSAGTGNASHLLDTTTNTVVEYNHIYSCALGVDDQPGIGIYHHVGAGAIVRYNKVHDCGTASYRGSGINIDNQSENVQCYYNVVYGNNYGGINLTGTGHLVYGNTCYHNNEGSANAGEISIFTIEGHVGSNMTIKNNVLVASDAKYIIEVGTGNTTGHAINYNVYYGGAAAGFQWGANVYNFTDWKTNSSQDANSLNSDPLFTNTAGGDFTLAAGSPCIDAGVDLTTTYQTALMPVASWPSSVLTGSQYNAGQRWECGAYLFPNKRQTLIIVSK